MGAFDGLIHGHLVTLKVCELCGRLYGQRTDASQYCAACEFELRDFPAIGSRKLRGRKPDPQSARKQRLAAERAGRAQPFTLKYLAASTEGDL
jgi:hypothetical protein